MLSQLVGPVDFNAALVLIVIFAAIGASSLAIIVKRRSSKELDQEFELAKIKLNNDNSTKEFDLETSRMVKFKQIDQGLITSHVRKDDGN